MIQIWPVIHTRDAEQTLRCAGIAAAARCPGVFLISMHGDDDSLDRLAPRVIAEHPTLKVGVNYLTHSAPQALFRSQRNGYDATWTDRQEFTRGEMSPDARSVKAMLRRGHLFFVAVAFKGQAPDPFPADSAKLAAFCGMIPTTSGVGTGIAPEVEKIERIRRGLKPADPLAVASGITPDNISLFAPHLSHVLVATGISSSFHEFDAAKISSLMRNAE